MNDQLIQELGGEIPLLTRGQLQFLDDVQTVLENRILNEGDAMYLPENEEMVLEIMERISVIEQNLNCIIGRLRSGRTARRKFLQIYPKWIKVREDGIEKLREIALSINTDRHNCNVSKLVGYCTSFVGGNFIHYLFFIF